MIHDHLLLYRYADAYVCGTGSVADLWVKIRPPGGVEIVCPE
jgi:hypothetical protein